MSTKEKYEEILGQVLMALAQFNQMVTLAEENIDRRIGEQTELAKEMGDLNSPEFQSVIDCLHHQQIGMLHTKQLLVRELQSTGLDKLLVTMLTVAEERTGT